MIFLPHNPILRHVSRYPLVNEELSVRRDQKEVDVFFTVREIFAAIDKFISCACIFAVPNASARPNLDERTYGHVRPWLIDLGHQTSPLLCAASSNNCVRE